MRRPPGTLSGRPRWIVAGAGLVLAAGLLVPAAADWLVTRDGGRIETDGPWRVDDRLVVFKNADGTLASMRLSAVDLEASERLTREMAERARAPRAESADAPRKATIRLTERELPPVGSSADGNGNGSIQVAPADGADEAGPAAESLQITTWDELERSGDDAGTAFLGEVRNVTDRTALGVGVEVTLYDTAGAEITTAPAVLTTTALPAGESARFRASFPDTFYYARVDFRSTGTLVDPARRDAVDEDDDPELDADSEDSEDS